MLKGRRTQGLSRSQPLSRQQQQCQRHSQLWKLKVEVEVRKHQHLAWAPGLWGAPQGRPETSQCPGVHPRVAALRPPSPSLLCAASISLGLWSPLPPTWGPTCWQPRGTWYAPGAPSTLPFVRQMTNALSPDTGLATCDLWFAT